MWDTTLGGLKGPCPQVQVFHREYRENEAKIEAKVNVTLTHLISNVYKEFMLELDVLGDSFRVENVTSVPSRSRVQKVSNGTGKKNLHFRTGPRI